MERQTLTWSVNSTIRRSWHRARSARAGLALKTPCFLIGLSALGVAAAGQTAPFLFLGDRGAEATASLPAQSLGWASQLAPGLTQAAAAQTEHAPQDRIAGYLKMPLRFEVNQGQTDKRVRFISRGLGYTLFLTSRKAVLVLAAPAAKQRASGERSRPEAAASPRTPPVVVGLELTGANSHAAITEEDPLPTKSNYFIGNDPNKWRNNIPNYAKVRYRDVYPGIDLIYYGNQRRLEHDFVVAPDADPSQITLGLRGVTNLRIDSGDLVMSTAGGELRLLKPEIYQVVNGARRIVPGGYALKGENRVGFDVAEFDRRRPLVIDPVLSYSTYLGGSGNGFDGDEGLGIAVDSSGNAYLTGETTSANFPTTTGAFQTTLNGGTCSYVGGTGTCSNVFVTKLNSTGTALLYSTYLGGPTSLNHGDVGRAIVVDSSGNAYVTGSTDSADFPTTSGAYQTTYPGGIYAPGCTNNDCDSVNAFVTKLNPTGAALLYSTYLGGGGSSSTGDYGDSIAVDSSGNAYVTGSTGSNNFPTTSGAFQTTLSGGFAGNAFVTKLNSTGTALLYSTYLGGPNNGSNGDGGAGIAVDSSGNAYVAGYTASISFPTTSGAFQTTLATSLNGGLNAFVTKLNSTGTALLYSTYLGGSVTDSADGIALDSSGNAYVAGFTDSTNFPTTSGAFQTSNNGISSPCCSGNAFVTKLNPTGTALLYSTYLGGTSEYGDSAYGIALDSSGNAYVIGRAASTNFPITPNALQTTLATSVTGGDNAFVTELNSTGTALLYSTYLGGSTADEGYGIALDSSGSIYVIGITVSTDFPITSGAFQTTLGGKKSNAFAAKIIASTLTNQTITVTEAAPSSAADDSSFDVAATASSGLDVAITTTGACSGAGSGSATITMTAATGTCTVAYNQAGNSTYAAATQVTNTTAATSAQPTAQTITVTEAAPASAVINNTFNVAATASSGLDVAITTTGACSGAGSGSATITMTTAAGTCIVAYNQAGNSTYAAATQVTNTTAATSAQPTAQTITVTEAAPASAVINNTFNVAATASSGLPVSIAASGACSGAGSGSATITMTAATGTCTVAYNQAGNSTYAAATQVTNTTAATSAQPTAQTITVTEAAPASAVINNTFNVAATASSGLDVAITTTGACSGSGSGSAAITMTAAAGTCTVAYNQAGNSTYAAATQVTNTTAATALAPVASLTANGLLNFTATVGTTSAAQTVMLTNTGNATLSITGIPITGVNPSDFSQTNTCGSSLGIGSSCIISVTFTPVSATTFAAAVSITDNASGSPQEITLNGTGTAAPVASFTVSSPTSPQSVQPGSTATYTITVTPQSGAFTNPVALTASGLPTGATANFMPASITPGGSAATSILTIQTAEQVAEKTGRQWPLAAPVALAGFALFFFPGKRRRRWVALGILLFASLGAIASLTGCGGGFPLQGSAATSFDITVTGTSGTEVQITTVQLTVN